MTNWLAAFDRRFGVEYAPDKNDKNAKNPLHGSFDNFGNFVRGIDPRRKAAIEPASEPICIVCREPVERGTLGTGALAGRDLHMDCYRKQFPEGHQGMNGS